jgi:magnesium-transporting ATPase (P-type)
MLTIETFALVVLAIIIIAVQHLVNWFIRSVWEEEHPNNGVLTLIGVVIALGITIICFRYMYEWTIDANIKYLLQ